MSLKVTDKTQPHFFLDGEDEQEVFDALGVTSWEEVDRGVQVAIMLAYGVGYEDGEWVGSDRGVEGVDYVGEPSSPDGILRI